MHFEMGVLWKKYSLMVLYCICTSKNCVFGFLNILVGVLLERIGEILRVSGLGRFF